MRIAQIDMKILSSLRVFFVRIAQISVCPEKDAAQMGTLGSGYTVRSE